MSLEYWKSSTQNFKNASWPERLEKIIIFIAHIFLLGWIFHALYKGGQYSLFKTFLNFLGLSIYGSCLIWISAIITKRRHFKNGH